MREWNSFDTRWMLSLFGTAVGAGILFLPIRAGAGGFFPVVVMTILIFPMVWFSHRALARFVCAAKDKDMDITHAAQEHWGMGASITITILYFFAIYPICLAYGVGITNTFESFFINQLNITSFYNNETKQLYPIVRAALVFVLITFMMLVMLFSEKFITNVCNILVYPLCIVLFLFSLYLIPYWKIESIKYIPNTKDFFVAVWLTLPVLVFAFNHSPAISTFSKSVRREYDELTSHKIKQILRNTSIMLLVFVMFFVFSCILCLDSNDLKEARAANIPILSYFANKFQNDMGGKTSLTYITISYGAPLVAFLAILTSFFGHYFGAAEGLNGIVRKTLKSLGNKNPNLKKINTFTTIFMYATLIFVSYINPSVLDFIESLGGPIIAIILFIMPIIALYSVPKMKKWQNKALDIFILVTGILTIISVIYKLF